jgi:alkaline phosphatase D
MSRRLSRRAALAGSAGVWAASLVTSCTATLLRSDPFTLGVASGDPLPNGVVLWTRLAPDPLNGGGMPPQAVEVEWQIARDERMQRIVRRGTAIAAPDFAHSVHVDVDGLEPARWYWYRFTAGGYASAVGRTRTAPAGRFDRLRFAFASCQHWEHGYYTAYRHMAREELDLVIHLGDYIYEYSAAGTPQAAQRPRLQPAGIAKSLAEYRALHALYKTDPDLQAAHAAAPWVVTWDDHEVENDYANDSGQERTPALKFLQQRAAAYQAYWEHMPLRLQQRPSGPDMPLYRRLSFGDLVELNVMDGRQHRSPLVCPRSPPEKNNARVVDAAACPEHADESRSMFGMAQERWLADGLARSPAQWNVIAQGVLMSQLDQKPGPGRALWTESWDAFPAARRRLLGLLRDRRVANPVVLTGDIHSFWANDLKVDFADTAAPAVASEYVCTSITSRGAPHEMFAAFLPENPHIRFMDARVHGYAACTVERDRWTTTFRAVESVLDRAGGIRNLVTFVTENGRAGVVAA